MEASVQQPSSSKHHHRIRTTRPPVRGLTGAAVICAALLALTSPSRAGQNPNCDLCLNGLVHYSSQGGVADITVNEIDNLRNGGISGTLQVELWMTGAPYAGGTIIGYVVASFTLNPLLGGYFLSNVDSGTIPFVPPPDGTYYAVLTLAEFNGISFGIVDWDNFPNLVTFGPPPIVTTTTLPPIATTTTTTTTAPTTTTTTSTTLPPPIPRKQCQSACVPEIQACRASCSAPGRKKCRMRCKPRVVRLCKTTGHCT